ncbi:hypothetical protein L218DRAFT_960656 [Marasmius fiardii PR-910]|nr:hypothetical protein L218DRAFT_960656 [Marasmius fiardii PR-910]
MLSIHLRPCRSRPSSLSLFSRLGTRFLTTERVFTTRPNLRGSVLVHNVPTPSHLSAVIDRVGVGPIDHVQHEPNSFRAFLHFIEAQSAGKFYHALRRTLTDAEFGPSVMKTYSRPAAEVVAGIGYRSASRCILIYGLPRTTTEDSLKHDFSRFGPVEKLEMFRMESEETCSARVHLWSISSAMAALLALRKEPRMKNAKIRFGVDRFDLRSKRFKYEFSKDRQAQNSRSVLLKGYAGSPLREDAVFQLVEEVIVPLQTHGEVIKSIVSHPKSSSYMYLNFMHSEDAVRFVDIFNARVSVLQNKEAEATLAPPSLLELHHLQYTRAVRLGATRTLIITGIQDREDINHDRIQEDFSRFGPIIKITSSENANRTLITFRNIAHAMDAIGHIYIHDGTFRRYAGTKISFFRPSESTIPPPLAISIQETPFFQIRL